MHKKSIIEPRLTQSFLGLVFAPASVTCARRFAIKRHSPIPRVISLFVALTAISLAPMITATQAQAEPLPALKVGDVIAPWSAKTAKDEAWTFDPKTTQFIIYAHDKNGGKNTSFFLEKEGQKFLTDRAAVYVSNIKPIPFFIKPIVLPRLKNAPYQTVLHNDDSIVDRIPTQEDTATLIKLERPTGKILQITFWRPEKDQSTF
jgi:hypothetical protein